ncbi:MAG: hypothetical protein AAF800_12595 [Planctomycetota bacterium]
MTPPLRLIRLPLAAAALAAVFSAGCDDSTVQSARSHALLTEAADVLNEANQGFVSGPADVDYDTFRRDRLAEAEAKLDAVVAQGRGVAVAGAHRLLGGVYAAAARDAADDADDAYKRLTADTLRLVAQLDVLTRIDALISLRSVDRDAALSDIRENRALIDQSRAGLNAELSDLNTQRETATLRAEQANEQAAAAFTRAGELESRAMSAGSDAQRDDLYTRAYLAKLEGQAARRRAEEQQIAADGLAAEARDLETERALWNQVSQQVEQLRADVETQGTAAARTVRTAGGDRQLALGAIRERAEDLAARFADRVGSPQAAAAERAERAVAAYDRALAGADAASRRGLQFEQASARVELARVLIRHAGYADGFAALLRAASQSPALAGNDLAATLAGRAAEFTRQARELKDRAAVGEDAVIARGLTQLEPLTGEDAAGRAAESLVATLNAYRAQVN